MGWCWVEGTLGITSNSSFILVGWGEHEALG